MTLEIQSVRGGYGEVDILNGISLSVTAGQVLTVAGTNGAGKSTLAKAIVGLLPRVSGRIALDGRDLARLSVEARAAAGIGYVPQVANVFRSLSVRENLEVVEGVTDRKARIAAMFDRFPALADRQRLAAGRLSGGERQQLAIARALMTGPRVVIFDEPTAALSPAMADLTFATIRALADSGLAVFLVEQRARQALAISDFGCILDGGVVAMAGPAAGLMVDERAVALFLGQH